MFSTSTIHKTGAYFFDFAKIFSKQDPREQEMFFYNGALKLKAVFLLGRASPGDIPQVCLETL